MLPDLLISDGIELRRSGAGRFIARCPFHEERTGSFVVWEDHAHCYGCGWHGGVTKYIMVSRRCDANQAREILRGRGWTPAQAPRAPAVEKKEKPKLQSLHPLNQDGIIALAKLRCLSLAGIRMACDAGRLFGGRWFGKQCWVITDSTRNVAQFRRFDGEPISYFNQKVKALTKGSPTWPIGAAELESAPTPKVILVEGGPDLLAVYCFLATYFKIGRRQVSPEFTPIAMLGGSNRICDEALKYFDGKRVRILRHDDIAGEKAAERWTEQLCAAGASAATCCFSRLSSNKQIISALFDFQF